MNLSVLDIFKAGVGPSSSHTMGPMNAACAFVHDLESLSLLERVDKVAAQVYGSLALTGRGHCTDRAILLGLDLGTFALGNVGRHTEQSRRLPMIRAPACRLPPPFAIRRINPVLHFEFLLRGQRLTQCRVDDIAVLRVNSRQGLAKVQEWLGSVVGLWRSGLGAASR